MNLYSKLQEQKRNLEESVSKKYNKSRMFKRAHYLVKNEYMTFSQALKQVWSECKQYKINLQEKINILNFRLADMMVPRKSQQQKEKEIIDNMHNAFNLGFNLNK